MGLSRRARGFATGASAFAATLLAISFVSLSTADAASIVDQGSIPKISKVSTSNVVGETMVTPASVDSYWTPERMASAKPAEMPDPAGSLDIPDFGSDASVSAATGDFTPGNVTSFPQIVHGKIFFSVGASNFSCSGTVIDSANANVVFTAGHCVYDQTSGAFVTNFIFVPGYENGSAPFGGSPAVNLYTTNQWATNGSNAYDLGVAVLQDPVQDTVSSRQIAFDLNPKGREYTIYGYPSKPSALFDGEILRGCKAAFTTYDSSDANVKPYPMGAKPCNMQQGASGGGWVTLGNYVNSVVSYGYCDSLPQYCGIIFGPIFSNAAKSLYVQAGGSSAPTIKLLSAPPKVVRKRKVSFKFGGTAATLLGFSCKLDRQKAVNCSQKISITRLSPGKHTLKVRAVDQTGHQSAKQITRNFRVILPR